MLCEDGGVVDLDPVSTNRQLLLLMNLRARLQLREER